ncbi:MAG: sulfotransferase family 2 domain-containing protein [Steroidobacteraceae bacterium]
MRTDIPHSAAAPGWPGFWRVLRQRHFSPFKTYVNRARRTVVVLNPKVGTKSFRQALTAGMRELHGVTDPSEGRYRLFKKAREFQFAPLRDYAHAFRFPAEYEFFCFVRNPYARLRSAWQNKFAYGHEQGYSRSIRRRELPRLRRFARRAGLPGAEHGSAIAFTTFLAYVESQPSGSRDHHWDDQHQVLLMQELRYTQWFRMEGEFTAGMRRIFGRLDLTGDIAERILTTRRNVSPSEEAPVYTAELAARVHRLYARDFELFGYAADSWRGL